MDAFTVVLGFGIGLIVLITLLLRAVLIQAGWWPE